MTRNCYSYEEENIVNETRAIEYIKSNPKYFFSYARKKLKTKNKIGPFDIEGEKFTSLLDICIVTWGKTGLGVKPWVISFLI